MLKPIYCRTITAKPGWRKLVKDYTYKTDAGSTITVPCHYEWNGASTPWLARWIIPKFELTLEASCVHDFGCEKAKTKEERKFADNIFREMLGKKEKPNGKKAVSWLRRWLGYNGVRVGAFFNINGSSKSWE